MSICVNSILSGRGSTDTDSDGRLFLMLNLLHYYPPLVHPYTAPQRESCFASFSVAFSISLIYTFVCSLYSLLNQFQQLPDTLSNYELNKIFALCSFYVYMRVIILPFVENYPLTPLQCISGSFTILPVISEQRNQNQHSGDCIYVNFRQLKMSCKGDPKDKGYCSIPEGLWGFYEKEFPPNFGFALTRETMIQNYYIWLISIDPFFRE